MLAGADFIKTSTGKVQPAATLPVTMVMLEAVRDFREATGAVLLRASTSRVPPVPGTNSCACRSPPPDRSTCAPASLT